MNTIDQELVIVDKGKDSAAPAAACCSGGVNMAKIK
jgi:hypothetical protein